MSEKIKCATFDKAMQDAIPPEIRARMDADRAKAIAEMYYEPTDEQLEARAGLGREKSERVRGGQDV